MNNHAGGCSNSPISCVSQEPLLKESLISGSDLESQKPKANIIFSTRQKSLQPPSILQKVIAETIASFVLVFSVCAVKMNVKDNATSGNFQVAVIGGLAILINILSLGHISGSHINPVVTIAYAAIRHFPLKLVPLYLFGHLFGSILAILLLQVIYDPVRRIGLVSPTGTPLQSFIVEAVAGFLLLFVASAVATDTRAIGQLAGIAVGSIITMDILFAAPISGGGINPARVIGPAIVAWDFKHVWIYTTGSVTGALLGALTYKFVKG
eukprot:c25271_g1_i1 orf=476-1276(-)